MVKSLGWILAQFPGDEREFRRHPVPAGAGPIGHPLPAHLFAMAARIKRVNADEHRRTTPKSADTRGPLRKELASGPVRLGRVGG